ncbi:hypothetical protein ACOME3_007402 [Neoechinorhynchus agilis]
MYAVTQKIRLLIGDKGRQRELIFFSTRSGTKDMPTFREALFFLTRFSIGTSVKDCLQFFTAKSQLVDYANRTLLRLDEKKCVQYAVARGYLRRLEPMVVQLPEISFGYSRTTTNKSNQKEYIIAQAHADAISCATGECLTEILNRVDCGNNLEVLWVSKM